MVELDLDSLAIIASIGTAIAVVGTLVISYWQLRLGQRLNSANAVISLRERFDGDRMLAARRHLSERLLSQAHGDIASFEVVTFFELIGALTHRKILDEVLVWEAFGTWITIYYVALRRPVDLISRAREAFKDPLVFHEFEWLAGRIVKLDREMSPGPENIQSPEEEDDYVKTFLTRETHLESI